MTSFGWKRKSSSVHKSDNKVKAFDTGEQVEDDKDINADDFDWISVAKKRRVEALEDNKTLYNRLKREGVTLAEEGKYWQAINRWDNALALDPREPSVFEMKAQALIALHEWLPAISAAGEAVRIQPNWFIGHQTLGRAQMGLGEVDLAVKSFQKAVHLNPDDEELRKDDLDWALGLLKKKDEKIRSQNTETGENTSTLTENNENSIKNDMKDNLVKLRS